MSLPSPPNMIFADYSTASKASDTHSKAMDVELWQAIEATTARIGKVTFYDSLLDVLGALVAGDLLSLMRYSSFGAPDLIIPRDVSDDVADPYNSGLYKFDPFHHYWQKVGRPGVHSLRRLASADLWTGSYAIDFMRAAHFSDEIAVFLPPIGGASPTLILDRTEGRFTEAELASVERAFPLMAGLHNAHLKVIVSHGVIVDAVEKPLRLIDRSGKELAANPAWKKMAEDPGSGLIETLAAFSQAGTTQALLADGRLLVRSKLAADFGAAPGGWCDQIEVPVQSSHIVVPAENWLAPLTPREKQIVMLILEGHPIASIAKRLGVTSGTIKNHRLRLYQKLDITTERELFLIHTRYLRTLANAFPGSPSA